MTEHCHLLGTAGTGAHPGTATGAGTTTGHPWLSRTPLPAVTLQGDERRALSDGPRGGGGWGGDRREGVCAWRVTDGRVAVPAERLRGLCSAPAQCLASPQLEGRPWAFQPEEKYLKPTPKHPGAMGRRTGCLSLLGTAGTPSQPRCPARHRGKLRHAHSEPEERWRHKSLCSPLHSFRLSQTCPHCPLSLPALGKSPLVAVAAQLCGRHPSPGRMVASFLSRCLPAVPRAPPAAPSPPGHRADVGVWHVWVFFLRIFVFHRSLPSSALAPWPQLPPGLSLSSLAPSAPWLCAQLPAAPK